MSGAGGTHVAGNWCSMSRVQKRVACQILAAQGLSSSQIGQRLATTRNAIIGMCRRSGVKLHGRPIDGARKTHSRRYFQRKKPPAARKAKPMPAKAPGRFAKPIKQGAGAAKATATKLRNKSRRSAFEAMPPVVGKAGAGLSILELTNTTCRWPVGVATGLEQRFCGHLPEVSGVYCPHHAAVGTRPYSEAAA